jgi:hypothetical protein
MNDDTRQATGPEGGEQPAGYRPPAITYLGNLAELTRKTVGRSDGSTFLGLPIASI